MSGMESKTVTIPLSCNSEVTALVELDTSLITPAPSGPSASSSAAQLTPTTRTRKLPLNSSDPLYASLRDVNFAIVGAILNKVARRLSDDYEVLGLQN